MARCETRRAVPTLHGGPGVRLRRCLKHMELIILARLNFNLAAPTPAFYLSHLAAVEDEKDWSEDLSRHLVELVMEDHILARVSPSLIAQSVFNVLKVGGMVFVDLLIDSLF